MNILDDPSWHDDLPCVRACPDLRDPLVAGDFHRGLSYGTLTGGIGPIIEIASYRMPGARAMYRFFIYSFQNHGQECWWAYGDWCPHGRTAGDGCYDFLDGGGSFATRVAAEWAIHVYVAHLLSQELTGKS